MSVPPPTQPGFDKLSFIKYMKSIGRAYRKQATELVALCRKFVQVQAQTPDSDARLKIALQAVDDALSSAAGVKKKTSKEVDKEFERAIEILSDYEAEFHPRESMPGANLEMTVCERMGQAKKKDTTSSSRILNVLKAKSSRKALEEVQTEPTIIVEFSLLKSLPDKSPAIVKQVLGERSTLSEILWNFSRCKDEKRLTLKQNPHFYKSSDLPSSPQAYLGDFKTDPIDNFQHKKICVLIDKPGLVFLETNQSSRAFGNVWAPNGALILKDVCGKLEGESIVQASIPGVHDLWYLEESTPLSTSPLAVSPYRGYPAPTMTTSSTNSEADGPFPDWREPILQRLHFPGPHPNIRISSSSLRDLRSSSLATPSPSPSDYSYDSDSGPLLRLRIPSQPLGRQTRRPARHRLQSQQSPLSKVSPRRQAHSSPTTVSISSRQNPWIAESPLKIGAAPPPDLAPLVGPTSYNASRARESQNGTLTEPPMVKSGTSDPVPAAPLPIVTDTSPSGETTPQILHVEGGEAKRRGNEPDQADARDSVQRKGAARLAPRAGFTPAHARGGPTGGLGNKPGQADIGGSVRRKEAAMLPTYRDSAPMKSQHHEKVGQIQQSGAWQFWSRMLGSRS